MSLDLQLWLGSQQSYEKSIEAETKAVQKSMIEAKGMFEDDIAASIMSVTNGVAIINISGSLVSGSAGFGAFFGAVGYDDIRTALASAISDSDVQSILLNVNSGGGAVAGCDELAGLIGRVNAIKPVVTYTGGTMASAALWLGAQGRKVYAANTAIVGSIGILMVHMERSKMLEADGIKTTVIRAGKEKALASPYEPLSDKAKENLQGQANALYDIFIGRIAEARGTSVTAADTKYGQGKEFIGKEAKAVGLVDEVGTLEDAFTYALAQCKPKKKAAANVLGATNINEVQVAGAATLAKTIDNCATSEGTPMSKPLTSEQLAAIAAGVELSDDTAEGTQEASSNETTATANPTASPAPDALSLLQTMLDKAQADLLTARIEAKTAVDNLAKATADLPELLEIVRASVRTMGLHFGVDTDSVAAMTTTEVLAEHSRLSTMFKGKFKVGGVAAAASTAESDKPKAQIPLYFSAVTKPHVK